MRISDWSSDVCSSDLTKTAEATKNQELNLKITPNRNGCLFSEAPFFCDYVVNYLKADPALGKTREERADLLTSGGLTIKTTIDPRFQKAAHEIGRASCRDRVCPYVKISGVAGTL